MSRIRSFISVFLLWTFVGVLGKCAFLLMYHPLLQDAGLLNHILVVWYGLRLDVAIAGYLSVIPALLLTGTLWTRRRLLRWLWNGWFAVSALLSSLAFVANLGLYGYWGFPLDNTPLLYIRTSPADALASLTWWQLIVAPLAIILVAAVIYRTGARLFPVHAHPVRKPLVVSVLLLLLTALLFLPIRGGLGTGTNHTGSVYFSDNIRLNHAAVHPVFSFVEAVLHQQDLGTRYRFMDSRQADEWFSQLTDTTSRISSPPHPSSLIPHPNVILIVLESFSDSLMQMKGVTPHLIRLKDEGLSFTHFYANSFRTDRGLVAIHSGFPAQPTMSVMDMPRKSTSLPSIARQLASCGYQTTFYYGGDVNYSNMRSYFMGTGFQYIVSDVDFPSKLHTGKWGVADGAVFDRMLTDIQSDRSGKPFFRSIMTVSSHEPFDVPNYQKMKDNATLNAFSYADHCLGTFMARLKQLSCYQHTVVAIVPDHLGAFPDHIDNYQLWRYQIPFVILGGPIPKGLQCHTIGSQIDIPATLLGLLGIDHSDFLYSKDLFNAQAPHFAYFTFPDGMGMVTDSSAVVYDNTTDRVVSASGVATDQLTTKAKAYLQSLYDDLDRR